MIKKNIYLLGLISLLNDISSEIIMPILPLFLASLGASGLIIGLIAGLGKSVPGILEVFAGYWSDKIGKRKPFIFWGYGVSALAKLLFVVASSPIQILILRPIERIGKGLRTPCVDALVAASSGKKTGKGFGIHRMMDTTGAVIGSFIALFLVWYFELNFKLIFLVAAIIAFISLFPLKFVKEKKDHILRTSLIFNLKELSKSFKFFILIVIIFYIGNFSYMFFILKANMFWGGKLAIVIPVLLYAIYNFVYASLSIPFSSWGDRIGKKKILISGYILFGLICFAFIFAKSFTSLLVLFVLYGVMFAMVEATERAYVSDLSKKYQKGTALGAFHTSKTLALLPASIIAGILWDIAPIYVFVYGIITSVLASGLFLIHKVK